jgi:hypothetical protein
MKAIIIKIMVALPRFYCFGILEDKKDKPAVAKG